MDITSRIAYQKGKTNKYGTLNFEPESALDKYIIAKVEARDRARLILDNQALRDAETGIAQDIADMVGELLKPFTR